jgi:Pvc16 N-terminal domain
MDSTTLEEITKTIIDILHNSLGASVEVTPVLLRNDKGGVGFYLFHVQENNYYKNYPAPGKDSPPVNFTPMALNLFYQLSANSEAHEKEDTYNEQRWMSTAMKALHDHSNIRKTISSDDFPTGKDIDIKITLQTLTPSESVQYWAAAESPVRLSAYYEVSVVFLEPEKPTSYAGRVLNYGTYIFLKGAPQITSSENIIKYTIPPSSSIKEVKISPAQAPPTIAAIPPVSSSIIFIGNGFSGGAAELLLYNAKWSEAAVAIPSWAITVISDGKLTATIRETAIGQLTLAVIDILPGAYTAQLVLKEMKTLPNLSTKEFRQVSNQFPFSVMPRIDAIVPLSGLAATKFTITGYRFIHPDLTVDNIQFYLKEIKLKLNNGGALLAGEFKITGASTLEFIPPVGINAGLIPVRVIVNNIESPPNWITIT